MKNTHVTWGSYVTFHTCHIIWWSYVTFHTCYIMVICHISYMSHNIWSHDVIHITSLIVVGHMMVTCYTFTWWSYDVTLTTFHTKTCHMMVIMISCDGHMSYITCHMILSHISHDGHMMSHNIYLQHATWCHTTCHIYNIAHLQYVILITCHMMVISHLNM